MKKYYYIPVSSFSFPELASAEAISPTGGDVTGVMAGRGNYPTQTTGEIPVNPIRDVLVVYSEAVVWEYTDGAVMDYPLVIKIPSEILDEESLAGLALPSLPKEVAAWAYPKTVFFPNDGCVKYLFRTDEEMCQQIQRLSPFQEVKDISLVRDSCESFEDLRRLPIKLPDQIGNEIRSEILRLGISLADKAVDVLQECRTGACLGYSVGQTCNFGKNDIDILPAETLLTSIRDKKASENAMQMLHDMRLLQSNFAKLVSAIGDVDYAPCEISFKKYYRFKGRSVLAEFETLDSILRTCVDFIATYQPESWNWFGNEERFLFMRDIWNDVLEPALQYQKAFTDKIDAMRKEVEKVCLHFKSPNSIRVTATDFHSSIVQALYIVLECTGDARRLYVMSKNSMRPDYCLAFYGAFKGYAYFPKTLVPARVPRTPTRVIKEDVLAIVDSLKGQSRTGSVLGKIVSAVDKAMALELERQSTKAFLYILNNLLSRHDPLYLRLKDSLENDLTDYNYHMFKAKVMKLVNEFGGTSMEQKNAVKLAIELEDRRRDPVAFKYILDDCIRAGGRSSAYRKKAKMLLSRLDLLYGGMPSDIEVEPVGIELSEPMKSVSPKTWENTSGKSNRKNASGRKSKRNESNQLLLFNDQNDKT